MVIISSRVRSIIAGSPIDTTNRLSKNMVYRGYVIRQLHTEYVNELTNRKATVYTREELAQHPRKHAALGATSNKGPLDPARQDAAR